MYRKTKPDFHAKQEDAKRIANENVQRKLQKYLEAVPDIGAMPGISKTHKKI